MGIVFRYFAESFVSFTDILLKYESCSGKNLQKNLEIRRNVS